MVFKGLLSDYCTIATCMCAEARWHWNRQGPGQSMLKCHWMLVRLKKNGRKTWKSLRTEIVHLGLYNNWDIHLKRVRSLQSTNTKNTGTRRYKDQNKDGRQVEIQQKSSELCDAILQVVLSCNTKILIVKNHHSKDINLVAVDLGIEIWWCWANLSRFSAGRK